MTTNKELDFQRLCGVSVVLVGVGGVDTSLSNLRIAMRNEFHKLIAVSLCMIDKPPCTYLFELSRHCVSC